MNNSIFAQLGKVVIKFFAFFVKLNPMWAYRFTKNIKYYEFFLTGTEKEIKTIKKLLKKGVSKEEIRKYSWSKGTQLKALEHPSLAEIFITNIWCEECFDAAIRNSNQTIRLRACTQRRYTPNEEQIIKIANSSFNSYGRIEVNVMCFEQLIKHHISSITTKILNKISSSVKELFLELAVNNHIAISEQVGWALTYNPEYNALKLKFLQEFYTEMPQTPDCANNLRAYAPDLFEQWVNQQTAQTLCKCCLDYWARTCDERHLRIIEEKTLLKNDAESARQLVTRTSRFYFSDAVSVVLGNNAATTGMLDYVKQDARQYTQLVEQLLNNRNKIAILSEQQVAKFSDEHRDLYWKNMAKFEQLTAQQFANLADGELKQEIASILEDNAIKQWFASNNIEDAYSIPAFIKKFGNAELSNEIQCWLIEQKKYEWLLIYFCGPNIQESAKIAFNKTWQYESNRTTKHLSINAFKMLVDSKSSGVLQAYFNIFNAILPVKREYLLCSPLKILAIGIDVR